MRLFDRIFSKPAEFFPPQPALLSERDFWTIVNTSHVNAKGRYPDQLLLLSEKFRLFKPEQLQVFDQRLRLLCSTAYTWELWGAAYIIHGGCFEDHFKEFRAWLVAQGEQTFYRALHNPEWLAALDPKVVNTDWEGFNALPGKIYRDLTGKSLPASSIADSPIKGDPWVEFSNDLPERFPRLWSKFNSTKTIPVRAL